MVITQFVDDNILKTIRRRSTIIYILKVYKRYDCTFFLITLTLINISKNDDKVVLKILLFTNFIIGKTDHKNISICFT